jgi:signal transduction histidine kinase
MSATVNSMGAQQFSAEEAAAADWRRELEVTLTVALDELYNGPLTNLDFRAPFVDAEQLERAKAALKRHLLCVLTDDREADHAERVNRIARTHSEIGLHHSLVARAYAVVLGSVIRQLQTAADRSGSIPIVVSRSIEDLGAVVEAYIEALEANSRAKSRFLVNMSHALRNPLNALVGYIEMIKEDLERDSPAVKDIDVVLDAARQLWVLINQLLDFAAIEAGTVDLNPEWFDPGALVCACVETVTPLAESTARTLSVVAPNDLALMFADGAKVEQSLLHLLSHALQLADSGGIRVAVSQGAGTGCTAFEVCCTNFGDEAEQLERIHQPSAQRDRVTDGGADFGLAIANRLAEAMGGAITIVGTQGVGITFTLTLPQDAATATMAGGDGIATSAVNRLRDRRL